MARFVSGGADDAPSSPLNFRQEPFPAWEEVLDEAARKFHAETERVDGSRDIWRWAEIPEAASLADSRNCELFGWPRGNEDAAALVDASRPAALACPRSGGEAAASLLVPPRKSCGDPDDEPGQVVSYCMRGVDCRCALCSRCGGGRAGRLAREVEKVTRHFHRLMFWTLTIDGAPYAGRELDLFRHLQKAHAVGETMRTLQRAGFVGKWFCVREFHKSGMIHFHVLVDALQGHIPHALFEAAWNRRRHRPEWAGPIGKFETGKLAGQDRPVLGWVQYQRLKRNDGEHTSQAVARYICAYLTHGAKNPAPDYFEKWCDGEIDGKYHNAVMYSQSRGKFAFFKGVRTPRVAGRSIARRKKYRRRKVRERRASCRTTVALMRRVERHIQGEVISTRYEYLGTFSDVDQLPDVYASLMKQKAGYWLNEVDERFGLPALIELDTFRGRRNILGPRLASSGGRQFA